jgi:hypothetical protein
VPKRLHTADLRASLDALGWAPSGSDQRISLIFKWMTEATEKIEELQRELESTQRVLDSRTDNLV